MNAGWKLRRMRLSLALLALIVLPFSGCNKADEAGSANATGDAEVQVAEVGDIGATQEDIVLPPDSEVSILVNYHGWDVNSETGDPADREHVFSIQAKWGMNLHEEMREIVVREGDSEHFTLDIGDGQALTISPQWNERQRGSYLFQVEEAASGKVIAEFDARDTGEIASLTTPTRNGHYAKTVFADLDKRIFLQEVKVGSQQQFTRKSEFGLAYVGEGFQDMPVCKENDNSHWHFPRFEVVACPREWMASYSFKGLGEKLSGAKQGMQGDGGVRTIDWDSVYKPRRSCRSGG